MNPTENSGYHITGVKDGWIVTTEKGRFYCPFIVARNKKKIEEALKEALRFKDN